MYANSAQFLDSKHGAPFRTLCDHALIRRAEAEAIVQAVARQVAAIKSDATDDDIAAALPDAVDDDVDDDEHVALRRRLALERLSRHAVRLGAIYTPEQIASMIAAAPRSDLAIWLDIEIVHQRALCAVRSHLTAHGLDAAAALAAGEPFGMVPRDD
ncbi:MULTISPECIES: hypothetical protein [Metallibacterium]|jgi:hypothetical protein|uniref:hypothetical protein n=1 Tax=Metallibacterium TaxID=1218803 RepID=UPI002632506E|nr:MULTISPECIES: hypothetical protein [Metallibacterium]MBW8075261.1 hypothetical protein [Metallibacterium scheffleri]